MNPFVRLLRGAAPVAAVVVLAGCGPQTRYVAEVNGSGITESEFVDRVEAVTGIPETLTTDAGGLTMINMIRDRLTEQLAEKYHAMPSDEMVNAATEYQLHMDPTTNANIDAGKMTRDDLVRTKRFELEAFGIGTNGDKPSDQDLAKAYDEYKDKPDLKVKESYTVKILQVPDEATGKRVIADLKQTGDFAGAAQKILGMPAYAATTAAKEQTIFADTSRPELSKAFASLKPNEITAEPVSFTISNPQQPLNSQTVFAVAQLKSKETARVLRKDEVPFLLTLIVLQKTHPDWKQHYQRELADFTNKSQIHIGLPKYEGIVDMYIKPLAAAEASGQLPPGMQATQPNPAR